jgi:hypothetical protein
MNDAQVKIWAMFPAEVEESDSDIVTVVIVDPPPAFAVAAVARLPAARSVVWTQKRMNAMPSVTIATANA